RARTAHDDQPGQPADGLRALPRRKEPGRIPPEDQEELIPRMRTCQLLDGVGGVRLAASLDLEVADGKAVVALDGAGGHLEPLPWLRQRRLAVRRCCARDEQHTVELRAIDGDVRGGQMTEVDRVERAAQ